MSSLAALPYQIVDVFTAVAYEGNPLAVVLDADELTDAQMQRIAGEFNLSETVFLHQPRADGDYLARIFTPLVELPFAGHPSIGAAWVWRSLRPGEPPSSAKQECGIGTLQIEYDGALPRLRNDALSVGESADAAELLLAVGASDADQLADLPVLWCSSGIDFAFLPLAGVEAVDGCRPSLEKVAAVGGSGIAVFAWDAAKSAAHTRVFAGSRGVLEDPATGSAGLAFGAWLAAAGLIGEGTSDYVIRQGVAMGRPSILTFTVSVTAGVATSGTVAGGVVPIASGTITPPAA